MKLFRLHRILVLAMASFAVLLSAGCNGDPNCITFLDVVQTVLLGLTAAGGVVLLQNN